MRLSELGRNRTQQFQATRVREAQAGSAGDSGGKTIPSGTCDPLSALFLLRGADWTRPARALVFDGRQTYEMTAQRVADESVSVPAGKFAASRIQVELRGMGDKNARAGPNVVPTLGLTIWLAMDANRTPVAIEVALAFGSLRLELTSRTPGR
jgi:hypothetical protein